MADISREKFLKLLAAGGASVLGLGSIARAQDTSKGLAVPWGRLKFIGEQGDTEDWHVHPNGDLNLIDTIRDETSLNIEKKWNIADVADLKSMVSYPFLFMHAEVSPVFTTDDRANLREYLMRGGFLFGEDCVNGYGRHGFGHNNDFFFRGMADELTSLVPGATFERLALDHPLFRCFYHFDHWPHMQGIPHGPWGLTWNGRLIALLSPSDLHCAWANGDAWFGHDKQVEAMQMGTNIYIHAMTQVS
jgi:hypothetical protein